jgi:hypothetical protein
MPALLHTFTVWCYVKVRDDITFFLPLPLQVVEIIFCHYA